MRLLQLCAQPGVPAPSLPQCQGRGCIPAAQPHALRPGCIPVPVSGVEGGPVPGVEGGPVPGVEGGPIQQRAVVVVPHEVRVLHRAVAALRFGQGGDLQLVILVPDVQHDNIEVQGGIWGDQPR